MDSTPVSHRSDPRSRTKSISRLARMVDLSIDTEGSLNNSLELITSSPKKTSSPSHLSLRSSNNSLPLQELLLLSPSPYRKSRTRLADRLEMADEGVDAAAGLRKRSKRRDGQMGFSGCSSPRNHRRSRRLRPDIEVREERDLGLVDEGGKQRRRKPNGRSRKEKLSLVPLVTTSSSLSLKNEEVNNGNLDLVGQTINDLIMWRDTAKSTLWFGFGSLCFLSSCFAQGINFSICSTICQLGLLLLGLSFFSNAICQRNNVQKRREFKVKEDDILRVARLLLPATNLAISRTRELFSGEPTTTLKVAPVLLLGAEYGHLVTLRRICAIGFFLSFTAPKLYSCYSTRISQKVEHLTRRVSETWGACSHKKMVATSAIMAFWNLTSVKTRILTAFISLVILRCYRQYSPLKTEESAEFEREEVEEQQQQQKALVVAEKVAHE